MIRIWNGTNVIYDPRNPALPLVSPRLVLEDNAAGSLTFRIYGTNRNYGTVRKLYPLLAVERDGKTLFRGRVVSDKKDFYNGKSVEAEGKLAFLNDSYLEPFEFSGSPEELFRMIIENHNSQVAEWQRFCVGRVTVTDPNDYIVRSSEGILNSWEAVKTRCFQSSLGGHVRIRYEADGDYLDWLEDYDRISGQGIAFAKNLVDLSLETDATETYTAIRPVGAEVGGKKVDISSVNGGRNYIVDGEKAAQYGIIFAPESESTWEDVTLPENLLRKAGEKLSGSLRTMKETYEIRAVDLNLTDAAIEALDVCEYVPVESGPHGIHGNYLLYKAEIAITEPQNSVFWLGASRRVLSDMGPGGGDGVKMPRNVSSFRNDAGYISEEETRDLLEGYAKSEDVESIAAEKAAEAAEEKVRETIDRLEVTAPVIEEAANTDTEYILKITDKNGFYMTPNLKGENAELPFRLGIDGEDNYGYYRNDTKDFVPFGRDGGAGFRINRWRVVSANDGYVQNGNNWDLEIEKTGTIYTLSLVIEAEEAVTVTGSIYIPRYALLKLFFKGQNTFNKSDSYATHDGVLAYGLDKGVNTLSFEFYKTYDTPGVKVSFCVPDVVETRE